MTAIDDLSSPQRFYHGTKADLKPGDLIGPGYTSNYGKRKKAAYVYLTATLDACEIDFKHAHQLKSGTGSAQPAPEPPPGILPQ